MKHCSMDTRSEQRDRKRNEDRGWAGQVRLADGARVRVALVADGAGGGRDGGTVAELTRQTFLEALKSARMEDLCDDDALEVWKRDWEERVQTRVRDKVPGGFSTLSAVVQWKGEAVAFAVGDSPIFQVSGNQVERLFEPHTVAMEKILRGAAEEDVLPGEYSILTRAVGRPCRPGEALTDWMRIPLSEKPTWFVVGSDGVFSHDFAYLGGGDLMRELCGNHQDTLAVSADNLMELSLRNGRLRGDWAMDNATLAILGVNLPFRLRRPSLPRTFGARCVLFVAIAVILILVALAPLVFRTWRWGTKPAEALSVSDGSAAILYADRAPAEAEGGHWEGDSMGYWWPSGDFRVGKASGTPAIHAQKGWIFSQTDDWDGAELFSVDGAPLGFLTLRGKDAEDRPMFCLQMHMADEEGGDGADRPLGENPSRKRQENKSELSYNPGAVFFKIQIGDGDWHKLPADEKAYWMASIPHYARQTIYLEGGEETELPFRNNGYASGRLPASDELFGFSQTNMVWRLAEQDDNAWVPTYTARRVNGKADKKTAARPEQSDSPSRTEKKSTDMAGARNERSLMRTGALAAALLVGIAGTVLGALAIGQKFRHRHSKRC